MEMEIDAFRHEGRNPRFHEHLEARPLVEGLSWIACIEIQMDRFRPRRFRSAEDILKEALPEAAASQAGQHGKILQIENLRRHGRQHVATLLHPARQGAQTFGIERSLGLLKKGPGGGGLFFRHKAQGKAPEGFAGHRKPRIAMGEEPLGLLPLVRQVLIGPGAVMAVKEGKNVRVRVEDQPRGHRRLEGRAILKGKVARIH